MSLDSFLDGRVVVKVGDLTAEEADAIVNAANSSLLGGGGVDGAIHMKGGPEILAECRRIRDTTHPDGLPTGEAVITTGGNLPAKYVIHTVGPIYGEEHGREATLLAKAYTRSLMLAEDYGLASVAFPSISTGVYSYPKNEAAAVASEAIAEFLSAGSELREVRLVFFKQQDAEIFLEHQRF
jgi:O-acetyl-ADP-ribose deacetylase (regulator of RNase III)